MSEFLLVQAAVVNGKLWLAGLVLALLLTAFVSLLSHLNRMLYGDAPEGVRVGEHGWPIIALLVPAVILVILGVTLPTALSTLIHQSVANLIP
jgi:hypothetical protein